MARKLSFVYTLALLAALCTTLVTPVEANNLGAHARMIRRRAGALNRDDIVKAIPTPSSPVLEIGNDPNSPTNSAVSGVPSASASQSGAPSASVTKSADPSATSSDPLGISLSVPGLGSSSSSSVSSTSSSTTSSSTTITSSSTTSSASPSSTPSISPVIQTSTSGDSVVVATITSTPTEQNQAAASPSNTGSTSGAAGDNSSGHLTRNTIIAIVVVAACVGGAVIIWTVIRKWKFAPSDEFGDRLNPIDWRPTSATGEKGEEKLADIEGVGHGRNGSRGSNRSFVSADAHPSYLNAPSIRNNNSMISDLPAHDFTAGATGGGGLAPVGAYADLRRGTSPTPSMGDQYYRGYGATQQHGRGGY